MWNRKRTAAFALIALASWACSPEGYPSEPRFEAPPEEVELPDGELFYYTPPAGVSITSVAIPGEFNGWDPSVATQMIELPDGRWVGGIELEPGTYQYKYHFNGGSWAGNMCGDATWGDPANNNQVDPDLDSCNGENAVRTIGTPGHTFLYIVPAGSEADVGVVTAAGTFQAEGAQWNNMSDTLTNIWTITVDMAPGTYQYKYHFNGTDWAQNMCDETTWGNPDFGNAVDPDNDNCVDGGQDAEITIDEAGPHTFRYIVPAGVEGITRVQLVGSLQGWNPADDAYAMTETFERRYDLAPGTYEYKFIFDGNWAGNMCTGGTDGGMVDANGSGTCNGENAVIVVQ